MKSIKDIRIELAEKMIENYIESIGLCREETYDSEKGAWHWTRGSAKIEVFVQSVQVGEGPDATREYLRIFSFLANIPRTNEFTREQFLKKLLEMNDSNLGVKLTVQKESDRIYATYERDIRGMDYTELAICIADLEWWADKLDDELKSHQN